MLKISTKDLPCRAGRCLELNPVVNQVSDLIKTKDLFSFLEASFGRRPAYFFQTSSPDVFLHIFLSGTGIFDIDIGFQVSFGALSIRERALERSGNPSLWSKDDPLTKIKGIAEDSLKDLVSEYSLYLEGNSSLVKIGDLDYIVTPDIGEHLRCNQFRKDCSVYTLHPATSIDPSNFLTDNVTPTDKPFSLGGYKAWCCGDGLLVKKSAKKQDMENIVDKSLIEGIEDLPYLPLPDVDLSKQDCLLCDNKGSIYQKSTCSECEKDGRIAFTHYFEDLSTGERKNNKYLITCQTCDGYGDVDNHSKDMVYCSWCNGLAQGYDGQPIFGESRSLMIHPHSLVKICPWSDDLLVHADEEKGLLFFKKDGYHGFLMGINNGQRLGEIS